MRNDTHDPWSSSLCALGLAAAASALGAGCVGSGGDAANGAADAVGDAGLEAAYDSLPPLLVMGDAAPEAAAESGVPGTWSAQSVPLMLTAVWGSGPVDAWIANASGGPEGALLHWDGSAWAPAQGVPFGASHGVWGSGPDDLWTTLTPYGGPGHWDGHTWTVVDTGGVGFVQAVWGNGPNDVWAVGHDGSFGQWGFIQHFDGHAWTDASPFLQQQSNAFTAHNVSAGFSGLGGSGPDDVWAVGPGSYSLNASLDAIAHWDGTAWSASVPKSGHRYSAVWASSQSDAWAVGDAVRHWDGTSWSTSLEGSDAGLPNFGEAPPYNGVWGSGPNDVWVVGDHGTILHWNGAAWSPVASGTTDDLYGVWGSGPFDVWVVGDHGTILHYALPPAGPCSLDCPG